MSRSKKAWRRACKAVATTLAVTAATVAAGSAGASAPTRPTAVLGEQITRAPWQDPVPESESIADDARWSATTLPPPLEIAIAPPPEHFSAPFRAVSPPPQLRRATFDGVTPAGGVWAVVIGINDYPGNDHDLRSAVADADAVDTALAHYGVSADRRLVLRDGAATASAITTATDWLVAHASADATAVFFYAGHARERSASVQELTAADGRTVPDTTLADHLRPLRARRTWIVIAACYGGGFDEVLAPGRVLTAAAPAGQVAYETTAFDHSYLVEYMIQRGMTEGRGGPSVQSAFAYARDGIARDSPERQPVQYESAADNLTLTSPAPAASSPRQQQASGASGSGSGSTASSQSGSSSSQPQPSSSQPQPSSGDGCSQATVGIISCTKT